MNFLFKILTGSVVALMSGFSVFYLVVLHPAFEEQNNVRKMIISDVNINSIENGLYYGEFTYGKTKTAVEVTVKNHKIEKVNIVEKGKTEYARKAVENALESSH